MVQGLITLFFVGVTLLVFALMVAFAVGWVLALFLPPLAAYGIPGVALAVFLFNMWSNS